MAIKRKPGRPKKIAPEPDPVKWVFKCCCCGHIYEQQAGNFPVAQSDWFTGNGHYLPICRSCLQKQYDHFIEEYPNDSDALRRVCTMWDIYYSEDLINIAEKRNANVPFMNSYMSRTNMAQYHGKTYDDTVNAEGHAIVESIDDVAESDTKVTKKMVKFWGTGYEEADYLALNNEYNDWTSRHECKTKAQETLFKGIAMAQLTVNKAYQSGDVKKIKDASDTLQSLMGSANIKPNQTNDNALAESNTFGTFIKMVENTKPICEPAKEWQDVDKIGHYIRSWVLGPISHLFHLKNYYQDEYEDELSLYTVKKPEYDDQDDAENESIRQKVFGLSEGGGS